jgi:hypothetical protein
MAHPRWNTAIIGAGPVGLATALMVARRGKSLVISRPRPNCARAFRIDSVPAPLLALLVELGLHPARLGLEEIHDHRLIAWEGAEPRIVPSAATVHLMRPLLEEALLELARRHVNITLEEQRFSALAPPANLCLDATGRASVSATHRITPDNPAMCRVYALRGAFSKAQQAFRMAATPTGYIYRSGVASAMVLGVVQGRREWAAPIRDLARYLRAAGADWLVAGLDAGSFRRAMGGAACIQWNVGLFRTVVEWRFEESDARQGRLRPNAATVASHQVRERRAPAHVSSASSDQARRTACDRASSAHQGTSRAPP